MKKNDDLPFVVWLFFMFLIVVANLAWIGTLIWAIVYVVTHLGEWIN